MSAAVRLGLWGRLPEVPASALPRSPLWIALAADQGCARIDGRVRSVQVGMTDSELAGLLDFLRAAERLKTVTRSAYTSAGERESVAEHTWRLSLMALLLAPQFPNVDFARLVKICLVHDLGEAIGGDVPAPEQARRVAAGVATGKGDPERRDLLALLEPLPAELREDLTALWDEYERATSPDAKLAK